VYGLGSPGADHKLTNPRAQILGPVRALPGEALVVVGMPAEDHVGVVVVEDDPEWPYIGRSGPGRGEKRVVVVGQGAPGRVVGDGLLEPATLRREFAAAAPSEQLLLSTRIRQLPRL
jgi:hypothetical protein